MRDVTADEIRNAVKSSGKDHWVLRECSICGGPLAYEFHPDDSVTYNASCECVSYPTPPRESSWEHLANLINMQSNPTVRATMFHALTGMALKGDNSK